MNDPAMHRRDEQGETYLQHLQALASEIARSMECIATNALPAFRDSVAHQEVVCAHLAAMSTLGIGRLRSVDPSLDIKISDSSTELRQLTAQYAALLKHSGRSISLLATLCNSYNGQFQEARGSRSKHQTWSCEM